MFPWAHGDGSYIKKNLNPRGGDLTKEFMGAFDYITQFEKKKVGRGHVRNVTCVFYDCSQLRDLPSMTNAHASSFIRHELFVTPKIFEVVSIVAISLLKLDWVVQGLDWVVQGLAVAAFSLVQHTGNSANS